MFWFFVFYAMEDFLCFVIHKTYTDHVETYSYRNILICEFLFFIFVGTKVLNFFTCIGMNKINLKLKCIWIIVDITPIVLHVRLGGGWWDQA